MDNSPTELLVNTVLPCINVWCCLLMQPSMVPLDPNYLLQSRHKVKVSTFRCALYVCLENALLGASLGKLYFP